VNNLKLRWFIDNEFVHTDSDKEMNRFDLVVDGGEIWLVDLFGFAVSDNQTRGLFTGLQDIHQVDIYEGDIVLVAIDDEDPDSDFLHEVKYDSAGGCFPIEVQGLDFDYTTMHWALNGYFYGYEIIGNIYQNPELIKRDGE
jgi:uncharacterized phage protein (TIGR01671 family)